MSDAEWNQSFGEDFLLHLSNEERKYFALNPISPEWEQSTLFSYSRRFGDYHRVFVYFHENTILKVINETQQFVDGVHIKCYGEDDVSIPTINREFMLPFFDDRPILPLSVDNIQSFGYLYQPYTFRVYFEPSHTFISLNSYSRTMKRSFPLGEAERISRIRNDEDFHSFTRYYMNSRPADYFDKLKHFRSPISTDYQ